MRTSLIFLTALPSLLACTSDAIVYPTSLLSLSYEADIEFLINVRTTSYDGSNGNGPVTIQSSSTGPLRNVSARLTGTYGSNTASTVAVNGQLSAQTGSGTVSFRNFCGTFPSSRTDTLNYVVIGGAVAIIPTWGLNRHAALSGDPIPVSTLESTLNSPVSVYSREALENLPGPRLDTYYGSFLKENGVTSALGNNMMHNYDMSLTATANSAQVILFRGRRVNFNRSGQTFTAASTESLPHQLVSTQDGFLFGDIETGQSLGFNTQGQLTSVLNNLERIEVLRGPSGPTRIVSNHGGAIDFGYTGAQLSSIRSGVINISLRHQDGNLIEATDSLSRRTTYGYTSAGGRTGLLTYIQFPSGNRPWSQTYDSEGRVASQSDSFNNVYNYTRPNANSTRITGPLNFSATYTHDSSRNFTSLADANGVSSRATWDNNRLATITNRLNLQGSFTYTPQGLPASATDFNARRTTYTYTPRLTANLNWFDLTSITNSNGNVTRHTFDADGRRTAIANGTNTWEFGYRPNGQPSFTLNPLGGRAAYEYDSNFLRAIRFDASTAVTFNRDANNLITSTVFPDNATRSYEYDLGGNVTRYLDEARNTHTFTYNPNNFLSRYADPTGAAWSLDYDTNNRANLFTLPLGGRYRLNFDTLGRYRSFLTPTNLEYGFSYNPANQITGLSGPGNANFTFTPNAEGSITGLNVPLFGNFTNTRDNAQRITAFTTPLNHRFTATYTGMSQIWTDPLGGQHTTPYDPDPFPRYDLSAFNPNLTWNALRLPTSWNDANGGAYSVQYNPFGLPTQWSLPLGTANIQYNNRWLPNRWSSGDWSVNETYDPLGNPLRKTFSDQSSTTFEYDTRKLLRGGSGISLSYNADAFITNSNGITNTRDAMNNITGITYAPNKSISINWGPNGLPASLTDWTNTTLNFNYNVAQQFTGYTVGSVQTAYGYDGNGTLNSAAVTRAGTSLFSSQVNRNAAGQITAEIRSTATISDLALGVQGTAYNSASQPVDTTNDEVGRLTGQSGRRYSWTGLYLGATTGPDGNFSYTYNNQGDRSSRTVGTQTEQHIRNYALPGAPLSITRNASGDLRYFIQHPFGFPLYSVDAATNAHSFHHFDTFGNLALLTNDAGNVSATYAISLFGESVQKTGSASTPFTWRGAYNVEQEENSGLYYNYGEYYDSTYVRNIRPNIFKSGFRLSYLSPYYARTFGDDIDANPFTPKHSPSIFAALLMLYFGPRLDDGRPLLSGLPTEIIRARDFGTSSIRRLIPDYFEHKPQEPFAFDWFDKDGKHKGDSCGIVPIDDPRLRFSTGFYYTPGLEPEVGIALHSIKRLPLPATFAERLN